MRGVENSRRVFLTGLSGAVFSLLQGEAFAEEDRDEAARVASEIGVAVAKRSVGRGRLWMIRERGGEQIETAFRSDEGFLAAPVAELSWFMRDVKDGERAVWIEPRLFDLLSAVQSAMSAVHGGPLPIVLTSGYRTRSRNAHVEGAAKESMHIYGYASDIKVRGYRAASVALAGGMFAGGGVGVYPDFTHLDVWRVRCWPKKVCAGGGHG